jgi:conjugative relaxase-like TrwC/TraI family protein
MLECLDALRLEALAGQEAYYERSVADGIDDYYAGGGESPGVWVGRGAAELELDGVVGDGDLGRLIGGRHPLTSAQLRSHPPKKRITVERIDPATGERSLEEKPLYPVAGYDFCFSPPKSVSLLHALGSDEVRHAVNQAHLAAWQAALAYLEERACVTRKGKNGVVRERGSGFVAAAYQHRTSRAQDPHLHTHVIVANMARSPDREWRALDGEPILKHYRLAAGYLYQAQLRNELTRSLGVEWREPQNGMAEIAGVPAEALRAFSQRRAQVLDYLERRGSSGFYAAKVATLQTRDRKEPIDLPRMRLEWQARAAEHGLGRRELKRLLGRTVERELDEQSAARVAVQLAGPEGLTEKRSTFTGTDAVMAWAQAHTQGAPAEQVLALVERFIGMEQVAPIVPAAVGRPAAFSTTELLRHERVALELAARHRQVRSPVVSAGTIKQVISETGKALGREQAGMVRAVASSGDRVVCVVGQAGAGKTTALAALADAYQRDGYVAIGGAPSGVAAANLGAETGIPSATLHRLLVEARQHGGLPRGCLVVVDEAGMADTRTLTRVLLQVEHAQGKVVLVGDPAQLPAVGPGGLYAAIVERNGAVELNDNRRQRDELERRALALLRAGENRDYLAHAAGHGRLAIADSRTEAKAQLVADWWQAACADLPGSAMIAYRRADVAELNAVARTLLDREGRLGRERLRLHNGTELAADDRVLCTRNDRHLDVANGSRGTIAQVDHARRAIVVELDDKRRLTLPARYLDAGNVTHAYALTGHKTQGLTVERAFVLADDQRALKEWGYVALTRARAQTRLYTIKSELEPDAPPHRPEPDGAVNRLAEALTRPAAETLALDAATTRIESPVLSDRARLTQQNRLLADRRRTLEKERTRTARELHHATRELAGMGALGRARHGRTLRDRIDERERTLTRLDRELERLDRQLHDSRRRTLELLREQPRPERGLTQERNLERGLERERSLDRGLEL